MSKVRDFAEIISTGVTSTDVSGLSTAITNEFTSIEHISPSHIKTTLLYPAVSGNISNGTAHSGTYGDTVQTDGHKYYYTDIKGSKPIKDPRIGAHFGSQRHMFKSGQLLEQETATHGSNVYSIDGRENMRMATTQAVADLFLNNIQGTYLQLGFADSQFFEVTGYFNDINFLGFTYPSSSYGVKYSINGASYTTASNDFNTTVASPLTGRYVSSQSVLNLPVSATLGINTVKVSFGGSSYGIELIAQDTTDTASKSKIQIPAQTVISFNKQHSVSATAQHYDPFNGFTTGDLAAVQALGIDDTTSLGLSAWWYSNSSAYYRPYNGGRVVKWIDSSGTIKTSVNMMPFNATSISNSNINKKENASATNNDNTPSFIAGAIDHSQAEVAKTFHWREFGNGSANGNATYADASMNAGQDDIAYVMDDGLTSLSGKDVKPTGSGIKQDFHVHAGVSGYWYITFIGTGISFVARENATAGTNDGMRTIAQNLPYGTHVIKVLRDADISPDVTLDGVAFNDITTAMPYASFGEVSFHQPKMPPIPEDAVVLADYMLMADFVKPSSGNQGHISKGVRYLSSSRDVFYNQTSNITSGAGWASSITRDNVYPQGYTTQGQGTGISAGSASLEVPYFGTDVGMTGYTGRTGTTHTESINSTSVSSSFINSSRESRVDVTGQTLQLNGFKSTWTTSEMFITSIELATPIHTSSHYQTFETPFQFELVGGDRNMEQTNLVVTPDGKTWDEVTRDTSYIGGLALNINRDAGNVGGTALVVFDEIRGHGTDQPKLDHFCKYFAIAYDRQICLVDGQYVWSFSTNSAATDRITFLLNGNYVHDPYSNVSWQTIGGSVSLNLKRGDYLQMKGGYFQDTNNAYSSYHIEKIN